MCARCVYAVLWVLSVCCGCHVGVLAACAVCCVLRKGWHIRLTSKLRRWPQVLAHILAPVPGSDRDQIQKVFCAMTRLPIFHIHTTHTREGRGEGVQKIDRN